MRKEAKGKRAEYGALMTEAYDLDKPEAPPVELAYYLRHIQACGGPVLEAMCGSGRFLVPLFEAGIDVEGVDASPDMLASCAAKCSERGLEARAYQQFVHELDLPRRYRLIFAGGASFGLIVDDDEVAESLWRLYGHLLPGGSLLIEIETPRTLEQRTNRRNASRRSLERRWTRPDGAEIVLRPSGSYDPATRVLTGSGAYELLASGQRVAVEENAWACRYWDPDDFAARLSAAGFVSVNATKAFSDEALDGSERMVSFVVHRPA